MKSKKCELKRQFDIHQNANFDFLITCHEIKFDEL